MKSHWSFALFGLFLLMAWGVSQPVTAQSARMDFTISVDDDNENYYKFRSPERSKRERHNPLIWRAAKDLQQAKRKLWAAGPDFGGNRVKAIRKINEALAALWAADQYDIRHMDKRDRRDDRRDDHRGHNH